MYGRQIVQLPPLPDQLKVEVDNLYEAEQTSRLRVM